MAELKNFARTHTISGNKNQRKRKRKDKCGQHHRKTQRQPLRKTNPAAFLFYTLHQVLRSVFDHVAAAAHRSDIRLTNRIIEFSPQIAHIYINGVFIDIVISAPYQRDDCIT